MIQNLSVVEVEAQDLTLKSSLNLQGWGGGGGGGQKIILLAPQFNSQ